LKEGIVIKSTGKWYTVKCDDGTRYNCRVVGKFRLKDLKLTNPIAVGDKVIFDPETDEIGNISDVKPRENYILRQSPRKKHFMHLLACNVDLAVIIVTIREPDLKIGFIDRFLLTTAPQDIPSAIIVNKADLCDEEDLELFGGLKLIYEKIGYTVLLTSAEDGTGIDEFKALLKDKTTLVCGHSGVGKTTLVNRIQDGLELRTQELSDYSGKGQHTTTFAEMFDLKFGGSIIDAPGIKELAFNNLEPLDIAHNFLEFFRASKDCKFQNCLHLNEPKCAVKAAVETEEISSIRYQNYIKLMEETKEQNYWERTTDW